ncbi:hypothetical protein DPMN_171733 [Dreissena polymorpha]|uniref:Uncharacterized protein n=1 Tax=Dreissena polymorpha TaxID=45954 RepID=A0A9D4DZG9_DREPO|nr:hypothetical protein DPMN_171733 [Dreissena polymorpha]
MLTRNSRVVFILKDCHICEFLDGAVSESYTTGHIYLLAHPNKTFSIRLDDDTSLWEILHGLGITSLSLNGWVKSG